MAGVEAGAEAARPPGCDFILIIDMSGSMSSFFPQAREFAAQMVQHFRIGMPDSRNRMALIPFGTGAQVAAPLGSTAQQLLQAIAGLHCLGGTNFAPPLHAAANQYERLGGVGQGRLVIFQTDGGNCDRGAGIAAARMLVDGRQAKVYAVAVGSDANMTQSAALVTGLPGRYDAAGKGTSLVRTLKDYQELVAEVGSIVATAARAT